MDHISQLANKHLQGLEHNGLSKSELLQLKRAHVEESDQIIQTIAKYPTGEDLADAQWRTLICNVTIDLARAPPEYAESYIAWRTTQAMLQPSMNAPEWLLKENFRQSFDGHNGDKIFGRTKEGYAGMFPWKAQVGDEIYILFGGDFPFVLRRLKERQHFQLVGQCYIHGIMEGEFDWRSHQEDVYLGGSFFPCTEKTQ